MKAGKYPIVNGVMTYPDGREVCQNTSAGRREYHLRKEAMVARQGFRSAISGELIDYCRSEFDHEAGRGSNSSHRDDRIEVDGHWQNAALSHVDNSLKGSRRYRWEDGKYIPVLATPEDAERTEPKA